MILHGELPVRLLQLALGGIWLHLTWAMGRWVQIQKVQIKMVLYNTREEVAEPAMAMTNGQSAGRKYSNRLQSAQNFVNAVEEPRILDTVLPLLNKSFWVEILK